jgi:hypothetical protein
MLLVVAVDDFLPAFIGASFLGAVRDAVTVLAIKISFKVLPLMFFLPHKAA